MAELAMNGGKPVREAMLPYGHQWLDEKDIAAVIDVLKGDWITQGKKVDEFEEAVANYCGAKYAVAVSSGTAALHAACHVAGISEGYEAITTPMTFVATANAIVFCGGKPIFADIREDTININPVEIRKRITDKTKAIMPVDFAGNPADLDEINEIARDNRLVVIEDATHALGAEYKGKKVGSLSDISCFDPRIGIMTDKGNKAISKIKEGDYVLTHLNRYKKVLKVYKRRYKGCWIKLKLVGMSSIARWTSRCFSATEEHPILVNRKGFKRWMPIKELRDTDAVYIMQSKCRICNHTIPFYWELCEYCNPAQLSGVGGKISKTKDNGKLAHRQLCKFGHYYEDILPFASKLEKDGYRVIPIGVVVPDIIAIKDNKVIAYEVEKQYIRTKRKTTKYGEFSKYYDEIRWVCTPREKRRIKNKNHYHMDKSGFVYTDVQSIKSVFKAEKWVYNLEVEDDHSYYASGVAVHNCFSFHPVKSITTGEGGIVTTNGKDFYEKLKLFRRHGIVRNPAKGSWYYEMEDLGYNYRITDFQCALGISQLEKLDSFIARRREIAKRYNEAFADIDEIITPFEADYIKHAYHIYVIQLRLDKLKVGRKEIFDALRAENIGVNVHYIPVNLQPFYELDYGYKKGDYPIAERYYERAITLPIFPKMTDGDIDDVIEVVKKVFGYYRK